MIGVSYVVDAAILLVYAHAGTTSAIIGPAFAVCGLISITGYILLSEAGFTERFKDHYFVVPQSIISMIIMLAFTYIAPEVGVMFLCTLFVVFAFSSLRSTPWQTAVVWTAMALGLAGLFLLTDKPISLPHETYLERFATMTVFILTVGRCMFIGIFSSAMRDSLYKSGLALKEANKRIEELAELDDLTGSFNRRCIMRFLDDEIARAHRISAPCSIALIDLDWFKRINDTYGHPTGDEVLKTFAITVFANIRGVDRFGRYGGEEFLLVLPDTADRDRRAPARPVADDHCRPRLERILARHAGDGFGRRRHAERRTKRRTLFSPAPTARSTKPRHKDATASSAPDLDHSHSRRTKNRRARTIATPGQSHEFEIRSPLPKACSTNCSRHWRTEPLPAGSKRCAGSPISSSAAPSSSPTIRSPCSTMCSNA